MKTKLLTLALFAFLVANPSIAQDVTTVNATNNDISDNLDLRAVASIFGDSENLEDFERRLNNPKNQISNLDLNNDRMVDYLRVIEVTENNTHVIILQAVLDRDVFQDVATIEVERDRSNNVQVQVVGDVYMYGPNYIYEPVYSVRPAIYNVFWVNTYRPYYSPYYWDYYPTYYYGWAPYPVYRYRNNVNVHIHHHNHYNYVNTRRSSNAVALHNTRRADGYERQYPSRSFTQRNSVANRYELEQTRNNGTSRSTGVATQNIRSTGSPVNTTRNTNGTRVTAPATRTTSNTVAPSRNQSVKVQNTPTRSTKATVAPTRTQTVKNSNTRTQSTQKVAPQRQYSTQRSTPAVQTRSTQAPQTRATTAPTQRAQRVAPQQRTAPAPRESNGNSRGGNSSRVNGRG